MEITSGVMLVIVLIVIVALAKRTTDADASIPIELERPTTEIGATPAYVPTVTALSIQDIIRSAAARFGEDPALMLAIAKKESSLNPAAVNLSDPSYGLFQIQVFWLRFFGFPTDKDLLLEPSTASEVAARILQYFRSRQNPLTGDLFQFPDDVDVYNVGETLWARGRRNIDYRDKVTRYYRDFGGTR